MPAGMLGCWWFIIALRLQMQLLPPAAAPAATGRQAGAPLLLESTSLVLRT